MHQAFGWGKYIIATANPPSVFWSFWYRLYTGRLVSRRVTARWRVMGRVCVVVVVVLQ